MLRVIQRSSRAESERSVLHLDCGHHRLGNSELPGERPGSGRVSTASGCAARIGERIDCAKCDRMELPEQARAYKTTAWWTDKTVPSGVLRSHRTRPGTWGRLEVAEGRIRYAAGPPAAVDAVLEAGESAIVVPEHPHHVELLGPSRFRVVFLKVGGGGASAPVHVE